MLDGTALQTAAARISDVKLGDAEERGANQVMVPMEYTIDGSRLRTEFLLERSGTEWLFFHKWSFVPAATARPGRHRGQLQRGHPQRRAGEHAQRPQLLRRLLPRRVRGRLLNGQYFAAQPARATVADGDARPASLNLLTEATGALKEAVSGKVKEFLDSCADEADKQQKLQPNCPFYHATNNRVMDGTIDWSITDYPSVSIEPFGGRWVVAPLDGKARIKARQQDLFTGAVTDINAVHDFSFTTRLDIDGDTVKTHAAAGLLVPAGDSAAPGARGTPTRPAARDAGSRAAAF